MLERVTINHLAIAQAVDLKLAPGFNVVTGETGAGKSILVGALSLLSGAKATADLVEHGQNKAVVTANFFLPEADPRHANIRKQLIEQGLLEPEDDQLCLRREIYSDGKSKAYAGLVSLPISALKSLAEHLIFLHGQHENQKLLNPQTHLAFLDAWCAKTDKKFIDANREFSEVFNQAQSLLKKMDQAKKKMVLQIGDQDFWDFVQLNLEKLNYSPGSYQALLNSEKETTELIRLSSSLNECILILEEKDPMVQIKRLQSLLKNSSDKEYQGYNRQLEEVKPTLEDWLGAVRSMVHTAESDPGRLSAMAEEIQASIAGYQEFLRKVKKQRPIEYKWDAQSGEEILNTIWHDAQAKNVGADDSELQLQRWQKELESLRSKMQASAIELSRIRMKVAKSLEDVVLGVLADLGMQSSQLRFSIKWELANKAEPCLYAEKDQKRYVIKPHGLDVCEILLGHQTGQLRPLAKIASGGELARIMLALQNTLMSEPFSGVMVFDEVDTGVGGAVAEGIGQNLKTLSKTNQVLVVTHLHQIAAQARDTKKAGDNHFLVKKAQGISSVSKLTKSERISEVARMLAGTEITQTAREHARELIMRR